MESPPALSLVVPAYREAARLRDTVEVLLRWADRHEPNVELLLVDDGSPDATARIAEELASEDVRVHATPLPHHAGKGAAIRHGLLASRGQAILFLDADLAYGTDPLRPLLEALRGADLAIGRRDIAPHGYRYPLHRRVASMAFNQWAEFWLRLDIHDTQCGLKAFRAEAGHALAEALTIPGFGFDLELLHLARQWGLRIASVPVRMQDEVTSADSSVRVLRHGARLALDAVAIRWRSALGRYPRAAPSRVRHGRARASGSKKPGEGRAHT